MTDFDPDKFLADTDEKPFDPDAFLKQTRPSPPVSVGESAVRGAAQGATFGFADEGSARVNALRDYLMAKAGKRGDISWDDAVSTNLKAIRNADKKAESDNPKSYMGGQITGGVVSSFAPGMGALNAAKGAKLGSTLAKGAASGALTGAGMSEGSFKSPDKTYELLNDTIIGGGIGGATAGAGRFISGLSPRNIAKKSANVLMGTPEELTDLYVKNPKGVMNAPKRYELAKNYGDVLEKLKDEVVSGSKESRNILAKEGMTVKGSDIAAIYNQKADDILKRSEGVMSEGSESTYKWLKDMAKRYSPDDTGVDKTLSTNRIKDAIQELDQATKFETTPGKFVPVDDRIQKEIRASKDALLKGRSPAYTEQMKGVASDTNLLSEASDIGKNPNAMANVLRRIETDQYGAGQLPRETIEALDKRMGTDILSQAKLSNAREAFDKSAPQGSRNVNLFTNLFKGLPVVEKAGPLIGAAVDKYGRPMTMGVADTAAKLHQIYKTSGLETFMKAVEPISDAARKGNTSAIATMQILKRLQGGSDNENSNID